MNKTKKHYAYSYFPKEFFDLIFQNTIEGNSLDVELRLRKDGHVEQRFYRSKTQLEKAWPRIESYSRELGYDVDFTVVPRQRSHIQNQEHKLPKSPVMNCFWADIDVGEDKPFPNRKAALERILSVGPEPTILVRSGRGLHPYYCLKKQQKLSANRAETLLKNLAALLGADAGAARLKRLMRVPHTVNHKYGKLVRYNIVRKKGYRLKTLIRLWSNPSTEPGRPIKPNEKHEAKNSSAFAEFFAKHIQSFLPNGHQSTGLCPFHDDNHRSFSANLKTGLWLCHATGCGAKGNIKQFCRRMKIELPLIHIQRFPRERSIPQTEEWPAARVFKKTYQFFKDQIHFTRSWQPVLVTVWAMGTYLHRQFPCYGHLWLNSPTTHSGKSKLLNVLWVVCYKATEPQLEPTPAVLFRFPSGIGGTLLLDEVDNLDPQKRSDVISILNSYNSQAVVMRAVPGKTKDFTIKKFPTYCPKVIAGINNLPGTLQDRCIKIFLHRKKKSEKVQRFMPDSFRTQEYLRKQLDAWSVRCAARIIRAYRDSKLGVPNDIDDRAKDILEPLFAIASVLPDWVKLSLVEAAEDIAGERTVEEEECNAIVAGLRILKEQFSAKGDVWNLRTEGALRIFSEEIPSIETKSQAQALLRKLGFHSTRARIGRRVLRAYRIPRQKLSKLFERYSDGTAAA